ncbi:MAG: kinase-like domain-containing protein [Monoraphidium minutum]|nr:MAG: kinase-like domain-containing protein [Monoraphidium minutum]
MAMGSNRVGSERRRAAAGDKFTAYRKAGFVKPFHIRRTPYKCRMWSLGGYIVKEYSGARQKVESEIRILQQLRHDGLISYEFIADEGRRISIVMAWAGVPLREHRLAHRAAYTEDTARHMAHQLASALAYLHARGIVHRDIKPDNLGVQADDKLQLFDWGEAVALGEVAAMADRELSRRVGVAGTPLFMPPESLNHLVRRPSEDGGGCGGNGDGVPGLRSTLTPALDVWGLGTVVYYVLAGRDIFVGDSAWELEELADVTNCSSGVALPEGVAASYAARDFLRRSLERCPARRASAAELLKHPWLRGAATFADVEAAVAADAAAAAAKQRALSRCNSVGSLSSLGGAAGGRRGGARSATPDAGQPVSMRRCSSGRLPSEGGGSAKLPGGGFGGGAPLSKRPSLVEGAAVCEITLRLRPSASCSALGAQGPAPRDGP